MLRASIVVLSLTVQSTKAEDVQIDVSANFREAVVLEPSTTVVPTSVRVETSRTTVIVL